MPNAPRTLDVDLIVVGDRRSDTETLQLPHPRAAERAFVLQPWHDLEPDAVLPEPGPWRTSSRPTDRTGWPAATIWCSRSRERRRPRRAAGRAARNGTLRPVSPVTLVVWALVGGRSGGWPTPSASWLGVAPFQVTWLPAPAPRVRDGRAAVRRRLGDPQGLQGLANGPQPHQMVNRFVPPERAPWSGSLVAGGYLGYALSWLGLAAELAPERMLRSGAAALVAVAMVVAASCSSARVASVRRTTSLNLPPWHLPPPPAAVNAAPASWRLPPSCSLLPAPWPAPIIVRFPRLIVRGRRRRRRPRGRRHPGHPHRADGSLAASGHGGRTAGPGLRRADPGPLRGEHAASSPRMRERLEHSATALAQIEEALVAAQQRAAEAARRSAPSALGPTVPRPRGAYAPSSTKPSSGPPRRSSASPSWSRSATCSSPSSTPGEWAATRLPGSPKRV